MVKDALVAAVEAAFGSRCFGSVATVDEGDLALATMCLVNMDSRDDAGDLWMSCFSQGLTFEENQTACVNLYEDYVPFALDDIFVQELLMDDQLLQMGLDPAGQTPAACVMFKLAPCQN